jgi:hypothetical protein
MKEEQWMTATDPTPMLRFLLDGGKLSQRKGRLFSAACCRRIWGLLDKIGKEAVEVAEKNADGSVSDEEQSRMENLVWWHADGLNYDEDHVWTAGWAAHAAVSDDFADTAALVAKAARSEDERVVQVSLLRDLYFNPFRPLPFLSPAVLGWNDGLVVKLAQAAYEDRILPSGHLNPDHLAVLGDALDEAGADAALLEHLRGPGPHVRGCFAIDALTHREESR